MKIVAAAAVSALIGIVAISECFAQTAQTPGYMIANYTIKDEAGFARYMQEAGPLAPQFGGKVIVFNVSATAVEGEPKKVIAIAEFPSVAEARRFYNSPQYTAARAFRALSTEGSVIITEGYIPAR